MGELTDVEHLKQIARSQRQAGDPAGAVRTLRMAVERAGRELADLYGTLGGALTEGGDLAAAVAAYDAGFQLDARLDPENTYNELNRLVTRVLLAPGSLSSPDELRAYGGVAFVDVPRQLELLEQKLEREVAGVRGGDFWAAGDLAVVAALNGNLPKAIAAAEAFAARSPTEAARSAYRRTFAALARSKTHRTSVLEDVAARLP
jgi:hypothetical protein